MNITEACQSLWAVHRRRATVWSFTRLAVALLLTPSGVESQQLGETGIRFTGFIDASYVYDANIRDNTFALDQFEVNLERALGEIGALRVDVEWVRVGTGELVPEVEQALMVFSPAAWGDVDLTFGKFNAPIGFELLDPVDMYQFSHAFVFDYGLPTNLTRGMLTADLGKGFDLAAHVTNGWDQNADVNTGKTAGGRLGYSFPRGGVETRGCRRDAEAEAARLMAGAGVSCGRREFAGGIGGAVHHQSARVARLLTAVPRGHESD